MLNLLINRFVKSRDFENVENRNRLISLTGYMGIFLNVILFLVKLVIGLIINSISVISDAVNNLSDSFANIITVIGSYLSNKPADEDHPYGHGRGEYIASLSVGIFIVIIGLSLVKSSIESIINPKLITTSFPALIILLLSIIVKVYMYFYNMKVYKLIDSPLNLSQAVDSKNDIIMTLVVVLSVVLSSFVNIQIEGPVGLAVSIIIIKSGIEIFIDMGQILLGKDVDDETTARIEEILMGGKYVIGVHDVEIHDYGKNKLFGTAHVEVPVNIDLYTMHEIVDRLEKEVKKELFIDLSIHTDPCYCLDQDVFNPAPCRTLTSEERERVLDKIKEKKK